MLLSAYHVVRPTDRAEAINAFYYSHPNANWLVPPESVFDEGGQLVKKNAPLRPGGNRVRSSLEIATHEGATWSEVRRDFLGFVLRSEGGAFPWARVVHRCRFRAQVEPALAAEWRRELKELLDALRDIRG